MDGMGEIFVEMGVESAGAVLEAEGVVLFHAKVVSVYPDGYVQLAREQNLQEDGSTPPDDAPTPVINGTRKLFPGDQVLCVNSVGNAYVLGKVFRKTVAAEQPLDSLEALKTYVDVELAKLDNAIDTTDTAFNNFKDNAIGSSGSGGWRKDLQDAIGKKVGDDTFENFKANHITDNNSMHKQIDEALSNKVGPGHGHGWADLPNKGVHGNDMHTAKYLKSSDVKKSART